MSARTTQRCVSIVIAAAALTGCNAFKANLRHQELSAAPRFELRDARRPDLKSGTIEGLLIGECAYGIYRLGDDDFSPDRVALLRSDLDHALGAELAGRKVALKTYTIHLNRAEALRQGLAETNKGIIADLMNDRSVHGCEPDDLRGGFAGSERTTPFSPLVVVIDLDVDGTKIHTRWVESPTEELGGSRGDDKSPWHDFMSDAIHHATVRVIANVRAALGLAVSEGSAGG